MNVNTGKRQVPSNANRQPPDIPPPLRVQPTDIINGPNSQIPRRTSRAVGRRFSVLRRRFQTVAKTVAVVIGRRTVRLRTSTREKRYPRSQCSKILGAQKLNPPIDAYFSALNMRSWFIIGFYLQSQTMPMPVLVPGKAGNRTSAVPSNRSAQFLFSRGELLPLTVPSGAAWR
jgi:hypothetical protein